MNDDSALRLERFALAAREFCRWAASPIDSSEQAATVVAQLVAELVAAGCALGWTEGEPAEYDTSQVELDAVRLKSSALPFRYYSEVFNNLIVPPEAPVVGDIVDDLVDIYGDISPGLRLFDAGEKLAARNHWQFWLSNHWGEHATSALRALWSYLAGREGSGL